MNTDKVASELQAVSRLLAGAIERAAEPKANGAVNLSWNTTCGTTAAQVAEASSQLRREAEQDMRKLSANQAITVAWDEVAETTIYIEQNGGRMILGLNDAAAVRADDRAPLLQALARLGFDYYD